jgi:predicted nucleic acid-binding protein
MRLFLDANILFTAAHNPKGKAALVIEFGQAGLWQLVTSAYALEEARRNLALKFPDGLERLDALAQGLRMSPDAAVPDCPAGLPDKDCPIYRAAHACRADVLLTGDLRDFGFLMNDRSKAGGLPIQTAADFLNAL